MTVCSLNSQISPASKNRLPIHHESAKSLRSGHSLISPPRHGYCDVFFVGNFFWMFLVLGNLTCAQEPRWLRVACRSSNWIIPNTAYGQSVDYLRVGGSMFFNAILITRFWKYWILPCARFKLWHDCYLIWQWYAQTNEYHRYIWPSEAYNWTNKNDSHLCNFNWCNIH